MSPQHATPISRIASALAALVLPFTLQAQVPAVHLAPVVPGGLNLPLEMQFEPGSASRMVVAELGGRMRLVVGGVPRETPFLDLSEIVSHDSEQGLLGFAFHPAYASNRAVYILHTLPPSGTLVLARYLRGASSPDILDPASRAEILTIPHPGTPNFGGRLVFGPDGFLYWSTGDGGVGPAGEGDYLRHSQDNGSRLGKMLRIAVDGGTGYTIPAGNPNAGMTCAQGRCPEILHYGLRNPWRFSFDRGNGDLWIGDVGNHSWEEVDRVPGNATGRNFGWGIFEAASCYNDTYFSPTGGACAGLANHTPPVIVLGHDETPLGAYSVTGGFVYRGTAIPGLVGKYVFGDFSTGRLFAATFSGSSWTVEPLGLSADPYDLVTLAEDGAGELYAVLMSGAIARLDPGSGAPAVRKPRDADGSGTSDIFWADANGQAALWLMNGTVPSGAALLLGPGTGWTMDKATGDFNADGRADILWKHTNGSWAVWLLDGTTVVGSGLILGPGTGWSATHLGDYDGNGTSDIAWKHTDGRVSLWLMNGLAVNASSIVFGPNAAWQVVQAADLNGDGRTDLVWQGADGSVSGWLMNGLTATASGFILGPGTTWQVIDSGDFDGNGREDLVWKDGAGRVSIFLMDGLAVSGSAIVYSGGPFAVTHVADFDGDSRSDLLFRDTGGQVAVWLMNGTAVSGSALLFGGGGGWQVTQTGDYDNDGRSDLLWRDASGQAAIWTLSGTAVTGSAVIYGGGGGWVATP